MWVVVDRLTKYANFSSLAHPYIAKMVAQLFTQNILKLHGMPQSIVFDRDNTCTSIFWQELFRIQGVELAFSTAYHPQTDGQSEAVNKTLENYLRCFVGERPKDWVHWIPLAEFLYNTNQHFATRVTPFEALYGYSPPSLVHYILDLAKTKIVEAGLKARDHMMQLLKQNLQKVQAHMKKHADLKCKEHIFGVGEWVYLRL